MSSRASQNSAAAIGWAAKRKEAMERAARIREERKSAGPGGIQSPSSPQLEFTRASPGRSMPGSNGDYGCAPAPPGYNGREGNHHPPQYGRRSTPPEEPMPELDLRPVRIRRPPSSSRIHSQGRPTETLPHEDDWSSPFKGSRPSARGATAHYEYASVYRDEDPPDPCHFNQEHQQPCYSPHDYSHPYKDHEQPRGHQQDDSHTSYPHHHRHQPPAAVQPPPRITDTSSLAGGATRTSPSHGRRAAKPEWNSDFTAGGSLRKLSDMDRGNGLGEAADDAPAHVEEHRRTGSGGAPRAGRRSVSVGQARPGQKPDWDSEVDLHHGKGEEDYTPPRPREGRHSSGAPRHPNVQATTPETSYMESVANRAFSHQQPQASGSPQPPSLPGSVRSLASKGLEKLKHMRLQRTNSGGRGTGSGFLGGSSRGTAERPPPPLHPSAAPSSSIVGGYPGDQPPEFLDAPVALVECSGCGRKFNEKALARHSKACAKVFQDKRKPMDMASQRVGGTDAAKYYRPDPSDAAKPSAIKQDAMERKQPARGGATSHRQPSPGAYSASDYIDPEPLGSDTGYGHGGRRKASATPPRQASSSDHRAIARTTSARRQGSASLALDSQGGGGGGFGSSSPGLDVPEFAPQGNLVECHSCGRRFNQQAYAKHAKICTKVFQQKRKPMDMTKQRVQGTDAAKFVNKGIKGASSAPPPASLQGAPGGRHADRVIRTKETSKAKWRQQSEGLRAAMQTNRRMQQVLANGGDIRDIPVVPSAPDPSLIPCPHCGRTFNEAAAERHIPRCRDIQAKPAFLSRGSGKGAYNRAAATTPSKGRPSATARP